MISIQLLLGLISQIGGGWPEFPPLTTAAVVQALEVLPDRDGDGVEELLVGLTDGTARIISGLSGAELVRVNQVVAGSGFGAAVAGLNDFDGDTIVEFAVGAHLEVAGTVRVYSGAAGVLLYSLNGIAYGDLFGDALESCGDLDGDGASDLLIGSPRANRTSGHSGFGTVTAVSGATGAPLYTLTSAEESITFGSVLHAFGDLDGDQKLDFAVGQPDHEVAGLHAAGAVHIRSGATGGSLRVIPGFYQYMQLGIRLGTAGDLDGDQRPDLLVDSEGGSSIGLGYAYSAATGAILLTLAGDAVGIAGSGTMAGGADLNGDGIPDIVGGTTRHSPLHAWDAGGAYVFDGKDGAILHHFTGSAGERMGSHCTILRDVGGAALADVVIGGSTLPILRRFGFSPLINLSPTAVGASAGGVLRLDLTFPEAEAGFRYLILASASGTGPTNFGGLQIPLSYDSLYVRMLSQPPPWVAGARGRLDAQARGQVTITLPPGATIPWVGRSLWFAAASYEGVLARASSAAVALLILP
jgi:hypothetical protein